MLPPQLPFQCRPTDLINVGSFPEMMDQFLDDFNTPLPPFNIDFAPGQGATQTQEALPPSTNGGGAGTIASAPQGHRCSPCPHHHDSVVRSDKNTDSTTTFAHIQKLPQLLGALRKSVPALSW